VALDEMEKYAQARIGGNAVAQTTGAWAVAKFEHDSRRVATVPVRFPNHTEGAPGPSPLGTGETTNLIHPSPRTPICN